MRSKCRYDARRAKRRRTYTMREISALFGVHIRTVQTWHIKGLTPIDVSDRPLLFLGSEIQRFLKDIRNNRKRKLKGDEFYCPRCKVGRTSITGKVQIERTGRRMGRDDTLVFVKGICVVCGCSLTRFSTQKRVENSPFCAKAKEAETGLKGDQYSLLFTDSGEDKCQ